MSTATRLTFPFRHFRASGNPVLQAIDPALTNLDARFRGHDDPFSSP